jgi:hypothetical protein
MILGHNFWRAFLLLPAFLPGRGEAQVPADLARWRGEFATWLSSAPTSPYAVIAVRPLGDGLTIGEATADLPLPGVEPGRLFRTRAGVVLQTSLGIRGVSRSQPLVIADYRLLVAGPDRRTVIEAFGPVRGYHPPSYFPYDSGLVFRVRLERPARHGEWVVTGVDGLELEAREAGLVSVTIGGIPAQLRAYRLGSPEDEEADLSIYFRDSTSSRGSYPAGRFVELLPGRDGEWVLDLNRARNPFCAYSPALPCPAPWPGNALPAWVTAGERYEMPRP